MWKIINFKNIERITYIFRYTSCDEQQQRRRWNERNKLKPSWTHPADQISSGRMLLTNSGSFGFGRSVNILLKWRTEGYLEDIFWKCILTLSSENWMKLEDFESKSCLSWIHALADFGFWFGLTHPNLLLLWCVLVGVPAY